MIADATKLKATIIQAIQEINDGCKDLRDEGLQVMLPEAVDFEVRVVTDINAVTRTQTDSENDGSTVSLTEHLADDVQTAIRSGGDTKTVRTPTGGSETTTITHPSVQTENSGGDNTDETVTYKYAADE